jgi:DNA invertase Pin-like site-specific DNA recombinase
MVSQNRTSRKTTTDAAAPLWRASRNVVPNRVVGYVRISKTSQSVEQQIDALQAAGVTVIYGDHGISGTVRERVGLDAALATLREGDILAVVALDRLGRDLADLVNIVAGLHDRGAHLRALREGLDTTTAVGRMMLGVFGALAEYERAIIAERTAERLAAKKRRGERTGRRPALTPSQIRDARTLLDTGKSATSVARTLRVGRSTLYRHLGASA